MLVMDYSKNWQMLRKLSHQFFMEDTCEKQHVLIQECEAVQLMRDFLVDPDQHMLHPKRYSNSIINSIGKKTRSAAPSCSHPLDLLLCFRSFELRLSLILRILTNSRVRHSNANN